MIAQPPGINENLLVYIPVLEHAFQYFLSLDRTSSFLQATMPPPKGTWNPLEGPGDYTTTQVVHNDTYPGIDPTKADLSGKAVFVSGASRGVGRAIALSFAKAGASYIAIGARSALAQVEQDIKKAAVDARRKEPTVLCLKLEVMEAGSVDDAAKEIEKAFGKLDIVINNAAIIGDNAMIAESDPDSWWRVCTFHSIL